MAHSLAAASTAPGGGAFRHAVSGTQFRSVDGWQTLERRGETEKAPVSYVVGSGTHAYGFLTQIAGHLFQSPIAYYTSRKLWDMAPGYERAGEPDFSRPVTLQCLTCHSGKPLPVADTLNTYREPPFAETGIGCERCHGDTERHLRSPVPGSIVNPARLTGAARDSICEQCHLSGEVRIPNPGKTVADFRPGQVLEDAYTVYVVRRAPEQSIKVISHVEQLALSRCARSSGGRLWCGTCHDPHAMPANPVAYFRERCLTCHDATLAAAHAAEGRDCIGCHMPKRPAKDGGHTAFTDHRITRVPQVAGSAGDAGELAAWREPDASIRDRSLAMALLSEGLDNGDSGQAIRGFRMLLHMEGRLSYDAAALTALGTVLLKGRQPEEAERRFARALELRPNYAPYEVNVAVALLDQHKTAEAVRHAERAVRADPLLQNAVEVLSRAYRLQNENAKADAVLARYRTAMGIR